MSGSYHQGIVRGSKSIHNMESRDFSLQNPTHVLPEDRYRGPSEGLLIS